MGIPRDRIPWWPTIDAEACNGCGACLEECPNGVFAADDEEGKMRVVAPMQCVVLCDKCAPGCPTQAISFPDKGETRRLLRSILAQERQEQDDPAA